jgi:hypothetical protein
MGEVYPMRLEDRDKLARTIWSEFCKLSGETREPSCREWYVLTGWLDDSIPLRVILRAFSEFSGKPRVLSAMESPVEKAYSYYRRAMAL